MTVGRTADARFFVDNGSDLMGLTNVLGGTINGETNVTRQAYLGETYEQASVHAMGGGISFSTLYQNTEFAALATLAASTPNTPTEFAVICQPTPQSWQIIPVSWPQASYDAPADDAITRPWELMRRGAGWVGFNVDTYSATSADAIKTGLVRSDGAIFFVVVTDTGGSSDIDFTGSDMTGLPTNVDRTGIFGPCTLTTAASRNLSIATLTGRSSAVTGYVLSAGKREVVPSG